MYYSYGEDGKKRRKNKTLYMHDTREIKLRSKEKTPSAKVAEWARKGWSNWKKRLGLPLMVLAGILLAGGLLWQNNLLDPFKSGSAESPDKKQEVKIPIKEQPSSCCSAFAAADASKSRGSPARPRVHLNPEPGRQSLRI
jgi:hypothetical protein